MKKFKPKIELHIAKLHQCALAPKRFMINLVCLAYNSQAVAPSSTSISKKMPNNLQIELIFKGQLISEWIFGVFKSPKKPTKFLTNFCPIWPLDYASVRILPGIKQTSSSNFSIFFLISPLLLKLQKVHKKNICFEIFNFTAAEKKNRTYLFRTSKFTVFFWDLKIWILT